MAAAAGAATAATAARTAAATTPPASTNVAVFMRLLPHPQHRFEIIAPAISLVTILAESSVFTALRGKSIFFF